MNGAILSALNTQVANCIGVSDTGGGTYRLDFAGSSRQATAQEITAAQAAVDAAAVAATAAVTLLNTTLPGYVQSLLDIVNAGILSTANEKKLAQVQRDLIKALTGK